MCNGRVFLSARSRSLCSEMKLSERHEKICFICIFGCFCQNNSRVIILCKEKVNPTLAKPLRIPKSSTYPFQSKCFTKHKAYIIASSLLYSVANGFCAMFATLRPYINHSIIHSFIGDFFLISCIAR